MDIFRVLQNVQTVLNHAKYHISISWPSFMTKLLADQKMHLKIYSSSCTNTRHDVTFEVDGMVQNIQGQNLTLP